MSVDCREKLPRNAGIEHALSGRDEQQPTIGHEIEVAGLAAVGGGQHRVTGPGQRAGERTARAGRRVPAAEWSRSWAKGRARFTRMTPPDATSG